MIILFLVLTRKGITQDLSIFRVVDRNEHPIPYANIFFNNQNKGTITNASGYFQVPTLKNKTITITHVGFKVLRVDLDTVSVPTLLLQNEIFEIEGINVKPIDAKLIITNAISAIPLNYQNKLIHQKAFYRETLTQYQKVKSIIEGVLLVEKQSYSQAKNEDVIYIEKGISFNYDSTNIKLINGVSSIFQQCDIVKNQNYIFENSALKNHRFILNSIVNYNDAIAYKIRFYPIKRDGLTFQKRYTGEIFIDTTTFAILEADVSAYKLKHKIKHANFNVKYNRISGDRYSLFNAIKKLEYDDEKAEVILTITDFKANYRVMDFPQILKGIPLTDYLKYNLNDRLTILQDTIKPNNILSLKTPNQYQPALDLTWSSNFSNQLDLYSSNLNSFDYLVDYLASSKIKNGMIWSMGQTIYHLYFSNPFSMVLAESAILRKNSIHHQIVPFNLNQSLTSYCKLINNEDLKKLSIENTHDFIRFHTVRNDLLYLKVAQMEDQLFLNNYHAESFLNVFYMNLFLSRSTLFFNQFMIGQEIYEIDKSKYYNDRMLKSTYYLSSETLVFSNEISKNSLNEKGIRLMNRVKWGSLLNLVSPFIIGKQSLSVFSDVPVNFSLAYNLTPIGEAFIQNYWIKIDNKPYKLGLTFYRADHVLGYHFNFNIFQNNITENLILSSSFSFWNQPQNYDYNADELDYGFGVKQNLIYKFNTNYSISIGYKLKTEGYIPDNLSLEKDGTFSAGINIKL